MTTITDNRKEYDRVLDEIKLLDHSYVLTGFQEGEVTHAQSKRGRKKKANLSIPQIAAQNEFGTRIIPARPFMSTSFDENRTQINKNIDIQYNKILQGRSTVKTSLSLIGLFMEKLIQKKIRAIHYPPNSQRTIKEKGSSKPLIDFGQMISAVASKVFIK